MHDASGYLNQAAGVAASRVELAVLLAAVADDEAMAPYVLVVAVAAGLRLTFVAGLAASSSGSVFNPPHGGFS